MKILLSIVFTFALYAPAGAQTFNVTGTAGNKITLTEITSFNQPWAMTALPDGSMLVTTRPGKLFLVKPDGTRQEIKGVPKIAYGGQGGLGDVILHPNYARNKLIYISYASEKNGKRGAEVARAKLNLNKKGGGNLTDIKMIWEQKPKVTGAGHYSHRLAFGPSGSIHEGMIFITSGDRQKLDPAQDMNSSLGKIIRLSDSGAIPNDNPWSDSPKGTLERTFWSIGHRNMLGIAFDSKGQLWATEMGPRHGDELNLIEPKLNYGWPLVSEGNHYSGEPIPNHDTRPEFEPPKAFWVPSIAPSGLIIYNGKTFPKWQNNAFIGGLVSRALIRVELNGKTATEAERFKWDKRIREVEQGPEGGIWVLEDGDGGRLLQLE